MSSTSSRTSLKIVPLEPGDGTSTPQESSNPFRRSLQVATKPVAGLWPTTTVDEWGRDPWIIGALAPLAHLRWHVEVGGHNALASGGALIIVNTRRRALTPLWTALAMSEVLDRPVRFVGRPDVVPLGPWLRRIGALLARTEEIQGALRAGELVLIGAQGTANTRHAGTVDHKLVAAAVREGVPVHVAATLSSLFSRSARVEVSGALRSGRNRRERRGPLAEVELAEQAQRRLQAILDEMDGSAPGGPGIGMIGEVER